MHRQMQVRIQKLVRRAGRIGLATALLASAATAWPQVAATRTSIRFALDWIYTGAAGPV
jgi:hypothetical protein